MTEIEIANIYAVEELKQIGQYLSKANDDTRKSFEKYVYEESEKDYPELLRLINRDIDNSQDSSYCSYYRCHYNCDTQLKQGIFEMDNGKKRLTTHK